MNNSNYIYMAGQGNIFFKEAEEGEGGLSIPPLQVRVFDI